MIWHSIDRNYRAAQLPRLGLDHAMQSAFDSRRDERKSISCGPDKVKDEVAIDGWHFLLSYPLQRVRLPILTKICEKSKIYFYPQDHKGPAIGRASRRFTAFEICTGARIRAKRDGGGTTPHSRTFIVLDFWRCYSPNVTEREIVPRASGSGTSMTRVWVSAL
jgi:hypothetical protein